jgi:pimeloyl-ACP methyl ester carboxylesterase
VLVHGSRLTRASWRGVIDRLENEFRLIAVDLPGHGSRATEPFTLPGAAAVIASAIDSAAGGRAVVVGHSLGGYAAMELAATSPQRVRGLVLSGASLEPGGRWSPAFRGLAWFLASPMVGLLDRLNDRFFRARYRSEIAEPIVAAGYWVYGGTLGLRSIVAERFEPRLAAYPGPTLILNGELDVILRQGERAFLRAAQRGQRRVIPGATHLANLDRPDAFAAATARFARGLAP